MFGIGKILSSVVRVVNAPIRAMEDVLSCPGEKLPDSERIVSAPLDALADQLKRADEDE